MNNTLTPPTTHVAPQDAPKQKKPFRFKFGVGLLILYPLMWLAAGITPFLPLAVATKAAVVAGILIAAEVVILLGIACVGKEAYLAIKARFIKKRGSAAAKVH